MTRSGRHRSHRWRRYVWTRHSFRFRADIKRAYCSVDMGLVDLWYPLECVLVPCVIGTLMYLGFELWERQRRRARPDEGEPPMIDYLI